jgi:hypothetical protein
MMSKARKVAIQSTGGFEGKPTSGFEPETSSLPMKK